MSWPSSGTCSPTPSRPRPRCGRTRPSASASKRPAHASGPCTSGPRGSCRSGPRLAGRRGRAPPLLAPRGPPPGSRDHAAGSPELFAAARRSLELRGDGGTGLEPGLEGERLGPSAGRRPRLPPAREPASSRGRDGRPLQRRRRGLPEPLRRPPALPDRRELRRDRGIVEMLVQSHAGEIHLLPALPSAWPAGTSEGCARAAASSWTSSGRRAGWPGRSCVRDWAERVASEPTRRCERRGPGPDLHPVPIPTRSTRHPAPPRPWSWTPRRCRRSPCRPPWSRSSTRRRVGSTCWRSDRRATSALP